MPNPRFAQLPDGRIVPLPAPTPAPVVVEEEAEQPEDGVEEVLVDEQGNEVAPPEEDKGNSMADLFEPPSRDDPNMRTADLFETDNPDNTEEGMADLFVVTTEDVMGGADRAPRKPKIVRRFKRAPRRYPPPGPTMGGVRY